MIYLLVMTFLERYPDFPTYDRSVIVRVTKLPVSNDVAIE